jgi:hypothetical protein
MEAECNITQVSVSKSNDYRPIGAAALYGIH